VPWLLALAAFGCTLVLIGSRDGIAWRTPGAPVLVEVPAVRRVAPPLIPAADPRPAQPPALPAVAAATSERVPDAESLQAVEEPETPAEPDRDSRERSAAAVHGARRH
jgi:hypothetical protein